MIPLSGGTGRGASSRWEVLTGFSLLPSAPGPAPPDRLQDLGIVHHAGVDPWGQRGQLHPRYGCHERRGWHQPQHPSPSHPPVGAPGIPVLGDGARGACFRARPCTLLSLRLSFPLPEMPWKCSGVQLMPLSLEEGLPAPTRGLVGCFGRDANEGHAVGGSGAGGLGQPRWLLCACRCDSEPEWPPRGAGGCRSIPAPPFCSDSSHELCAGTAARGGGSEEGDLAYN